MRNDRDHALACRDELLRYFRWERRTMKSIAIGSPNPPTIEEILEKHIFAASLPSSSND